MAGQPGKRVVPLFSCYEPSFQKYSVQQAFGTMLQRPWHYLTGKLHEVYPMKRLISITVKAIGTMNRIRICQALNARPSDSAISSLIASFDTNQPMKIAVNNATMGSNKFAITYSILS